MSTNSRMTRRAVVGGLVLLCLPAVGFALGVDRLHMALAGEERGTGAMLERPSPATEGAAR